MPQATDELRKKIIDYFPGNGLDNFAPLQFLQQNGWFEIEPGVITEDKDYRDITQKEWDCSEFLCKEWDYDYKPA
jgi:hypothetical protein